MHLPWILVLQVLLASASGSFLQTVNNLALSEVCRYTSEAGNPHMEEVKNDQETFREHEEYAIEWDVIITKGQDVADEIADRLGFINYGLISQNDEEFVYKFVIDEDEVKVMPRYEPYEIKTQLLMMEENVLSAKQKTVNIKCSKISRSGSAEREKRGAGPATNLRTNWLTPTTVVFSWDHPDMPPDYYRVNHAAICVSNGSVTVSYSFYRVPATDNSITLNGDITCINICHVNAVYESLDMVFSAVWLDGQATLQAPSNVGIDTRSCSSMQVSWQAPPTLGTYTYATVAYNGGSITYRNTGQTTSSVFNDLNHLDTFIVFVVAMQGNAYGAAYDIFTLESLRLRDGIRRCEGRVEVYRNGQWGTVCDNFWDRIDADVVCSQMQCGIADNPPTASFGIGTGPIFMTNVQCTSGDSCLEECTHSTLTSSCTHSQDVSVRCADPAPLQPLATPVPTATPVVCPAVPSIANGAVVSTGFIVGETLTYSCHDGYVLQGNAVRTCQSDGTWSGQEPVCNLCISSECVNQVRLVNGGAPCQGRVEVFRNGQWGTVCDDFWDITDANVVCSQLNCGTASSAPRNAWFGEGNGPIWMDNVECTADDVAIQDCRHDPTHNCRHSEDASAICEADCSILSNPANGVVTVSGQTGGSTATYICNSGFMLVGDETRICQSGVWSGEEPSCIIVCPAVPSIANGAVVATGFVVGETLTYSCHDGYVLQGNAVRTCQSDGTWSGQEPVCNLCISSECVNQVRLVNGGAPCQGRVEVFRNGQWGTVCDDFWDITDANVVCSQLNCGTASSAPRNAWFGEGNGPIWMDNVECTADDVAIQDCRHDPTHNCRHSEDASAICEADCGILSNPANGVVTVSGLTGGSTATYTCNSGFILVGDETRICQSGVWSGEEPSCIIAPPVNVAIAQESSNSLRITWNHHCAGQPMTYYSIRYISVQLNGAPTTEQSLTVSSTNTSAVIEGLNLTIGSTHLVIVTSVSGVLSAASKSAYFYVYDTVECPCRPIITELEQVASNSLRVTWSHPCDTPPDTHYIITAMHFSASSIFSEPALYITLPPSVTSLVFTNLELGDDDAYVFVITAVSGDISRSSLPRIFSIYINDLAPTIVSVTPLTSTTARVTWTPPPQGPQPSHYYIYYVSVAVNGRTEREFASRRQASEVLTGLSEGGTYVVVVTSRGANAAASDPVIFSL